MRALVIFFATLMSFSTLADWQLASDSSTLNFISTKNDHFAETHSFDKVTGKVTEDKLWISVPLSTVNTLIPIRNERMQKMLFDMAGNPMATFTAKVDEQLTSLPIGSSQVAEVAGTLQINGNEVASSFHVRVTRLAEGQLHVSTTKPTVLNAGNFKLNDGIEALRNVAGLKVISLAVPVSFDVTFTK